MSTPRPMANDGFVPATAPLRAAPAVRMAEAGFLLFLLLAFVTLSPFASRNAAALASGADMPGSGDTLRQVLYLTTLAIITYAAIRQSGVRVLQAVPPLVIALLAWCALSAFWSAHPAITIRRTGLQCVVAACAMLSVQSLGTLRTLRLLRWVLAAILIVNCVAAFFVPQAIHLAGEADPSLVGDWRGLYFHKNIAGAVGAITAILFFFEALDTRQGPNIAFFALALGFTIMTHSKSSLGFLPVAVVLGLVYRIAWRRPLDRQIALVAMGLVVLVLVLGAALEWQTIGRLLNDPGALTGRTAIWRAELAFIADHTLLGAGFGSFADTGALSPLYNYANAAWITHVSHGHSGYLQLLVTIGLTGFAMAMLGLIIIPAARFWRPERQDIPLYAMLLALFSFALLHNLLETDFLEGDGPAWIAFLVTLALMGKPRRRGIPAP